MANNGFQERATRALQRVKTIRGDGEVSVRSSPHGQTVALDNFAGQEVFAEGVIVATGPSGEADYPDNRYWIKLANVDKSTDATVVVDVTPQPVATGANHNPVTATNRHEWFTHTLPTDGTCWVILRSVTDANGLRRWVFGSGIGLIWVKITSAASGGGKYFGRSVKARTTDVLATGNLAASELGTAAAADDCLILNMTEVGTAHHDLTNAANTNQKYFLARIVRQNAFTGSGDAADGMVVVALVGLWAKDCA